MVKGFWSSDNYAGSYACIGGFYDEFHDALEKAIKHPFDSGWLAFKSSDVQFRVHGDQDKCVAEAKKIIDSDELLQSVFEDAFDRYPDNEQIHNPDYNQILDTATLVFYISVEVQSLSVSEIAGIWDDLSDLVGEKSDREWEFLIKQFQWVEENGR